MIASCLAARERFSAYLDERLGREERRAVRDHLTACRLCRHEAAAQDPAFLFAFGEEAEVSAEETARILAGVRTGIALKSAERRMGPPRRPALTSSARRAIATAGAVAAAAFVAVTLVPPRPDVSPAAAPSATRASTPAPAASVLPAPDRPETPISPFAEASGHARSQTDRKQLPADATIYDWNPGGGQPRVVWIVDRSLDI